METLLEGSYYLVCQYKAIDMEGTHDIYNQTLLPFIKEKASKEGEVYVIPKELEFKVGVSRIS